MITQHRQIGSGDDPPLWNLHGLSLADMEDLYANPRFRRAAAEAIEEYRDEQRFAVRPEDLRVDVYRNGGTRTVITHLPTGIVVENDEFPSELRQRERCLVLLRQRLREQANG